MLHADVSLLQRAVDTQVLERRILSRAFSSGDLLRPFSEDVIKTLFEAFSFNALPFLIVGVAEKDGVLGWNDGRALWQRDHFVLHHLFDRPCYFYDKLFGYAARFNLGVTCRFFQHKLSSFAVDPSSVLFRVRSITFTSKKSYFSSRSIYFPLSHPRVAFGPPVRSRPCWMTST